MIPVSRPGDVKPKVIVAISSHNYAQYITQAIDSVISQKTDFPFEVHIADDASTDETPEILQKYKKRFPDKIHILLSKNNGGCGVNWFRLLNRIDSEYFATLDSDDFWVGDTRLQKQADFLDSHPEYMICSGFTQLLVNGQPGAVFPPREYAEGTYTFEDYFKKPVLFHLSGMLLRNKIYVNGIERSYHTDDIANGDNTEENFQRMIHLERGPLYVLPEMASCYRIHENSRWASLPDIEQTIGAVASYTKFILYWYGRHPELQESIRSIVKPYYREMWQKLINGNHIFPEWKLSRKHTEMLVEAMRDMATIYEADHWFDERDD